MSAAGFTMDLDPFVAPQGASPGRARNVGAKLAIVERYNSAWQTCVPPWQQAFDQKLFG